MEFILSGVDLKSIATNVVTWDFISIWCTLIFLYFTACLVWLACGALPLWRALRTAHRALASLDGQHGFTQEFEGYNQAVRSRRQLVHPWAEFIESLVFPEPGSDVPIQNTAEVSQYLNDGTVVAPNIVRHELCFL
jgi:hypothetical protein